MTTPATFEGTPATSATFEGTPATSGTFEGTPATPVIFEGTPATPVIFEGTPATPAIFEAEALGDDEIDLDAASMTELQGQCRARGLDSTGDRETLIERILDFELADDGDFDDPDLDYADTDLESDHGDGLLSDYLDSLPDAPPAPEPTPEPLRRKWMPDPSPAPSRAVQRPAPSKRREPIRSAW